VVTAPYGSWASPITVEQLTSASIGLLGPRLDGEHVYWLQSHADQGGRTSVWRRAVRGGTAEEMTPAPLNVRSRVHEYGGGEYAVRGGVGVCSEFAEGRLYRWGDGPLQAITPLSAYRYGDLRVHPDQGVVLAVREDHSGPGEPVNTIVALTLAGPNEDGGTVLCSGADFYSTPELAADARLAWTQWDHPNMPWDSTTINVGTLRLSSPDSPDSSVTEVVAVAGGPGESAVQPRWLSSGELVFVSDRTNWWNLYSWRDGQVRPLHETAAEFCSPQWGLGQQPYAVVDDDHLLCTVLRDGVSGAALLRISTGELTAACGPEVVAVGGVSVAGRTAAAVLSYPDQPSALALLDLDTSTWTVVLKSSELVLAPDAVSVAEAVTWSSEQGDVHGWFYPPAHPGFTGPEGTTPPLITLSHGGPTAFADPGFSLGFQFWTSRGYAVLDVNYGGSTGYGRAYRDRLVGNWGIVDVADCANGARAMGEQGRADPARLAVKGGSAGGYTTLAALTWTTVFAAGISQYGIGDLETLATDTHKFESRYLDGLVGPYPQDRDTYIARSPIHHVDSLSAPILLLQGLDDQVVPPDQAETFAAAARAKGLPVALILFPGEGHGFRRAETIKASLEAQIYFLGRIFGFTPADDVPPIKIDNLA
jgi:dipeptidyl aminopeptidase/acylaminoacyl peptidase